MKEYIEVEFRTGNLGYYLKPEDCNFLPDELIVVEVERGKDIAKVVHTSLPESSIEIKIKDIDTKKITRIANEEDYNILADVVENEKQATLQFNDILKKYPFEMKLVSTIFQYDGNKLTFFFTAEGRIDFREFVRELARIFRTRIELHQTSGRDEAKRLGGYGMCGYKYCCASYMKRFNQVTIKMAKDKNLYNNSLSKISGPCGRLLCCINYSQTNLSKDFPKLGDEVIFNGEKMYVFEVDSYEKKVHLSNQDQVIEIIDLDKYKTLKKIYDK